MKIGDQHLILRVFKLCLFLLFFSCSKDTSNTVKFIYTSENSCENSEGGEKSIVINDTLIIQHLSALPFNKITFQNPKDTTSLLFPTKYDNASILKIDTTIFVLDGDRVFKVNHLKYLSHLKYDYMNAPSDKREEFDKDYKTVIDKLQYFYFEDLDLKDDNHSIGDSYPIGMFERNGCLNVVTSNLYSMVINRNFTVFVNEIENGNVVKSYKVLETKLSKYYYSQESQKVGKYLNVQVKERLSSSTCINLLFKQDSVIISNNSGIEILYPAVAAFPKS